MSLAAPAVQATPDEIVVFTDELEKKGETGYVVHLNYAARARRTPDYPQEQPPHHVFRLMPEVAWGFAEKWNLGVHVPFSHDQRARRTTLDGLKLRLHYLNLVEQGARRTFYYGVNYEIAIYNRRISESRYNAELRTIVGMTRGDWKFTLNPIFNQALSGNPGGRAVEFELFSQVMRELNQHVALGIEHFASPGRVSRLDFGSQSEQITYLVADVKIRKDWHIHFGVGHGWHRADDQRVYKALIVLPF
jgi:hypothetical protein